MNFVTEGNINSYYGEQTKIDDSNTSSGINLTVGTLVDVSKKVFIDLLFDFTNLNKKGNAPNTTFNTEIILCKVGVCIRV